MNGFKATSGFTNNKGVKYVSGKCTLNDVEFQCGSGGGGNGPLPAGLWKIGKVRRLDLTKENDAYTRDGSAWFCPLIPTFTTDRTEIGIHPDGNVLGTMGCVGIQERFNEAYEILTGLEGKEFTVEGALT